MDLRLKNRVAMVSAASKGIGRGIARALLKEGCHVSICARTVSDLENTRRELQEEAGAARILAFPCDVSRSEDLNRWYQETKKALGTIDILVTNTGGPPAGRFMELTEDRWLHGIESTLMNVVRLSRLVIPDMQKQKWGRILHITSLAAKQPVDILAISNTLRAGISALTKTLSNEYASYGICINALLPGHILTDRQKELNSIKSKELGITIEQYAEKIRKSIPAGRYGSPEEIGDVAAFLCSDRAGYLSGASIQVDGGLIQSTF